MMPPTDTGQMHPSNRVPVRIENGQFKTALEQWLEDDHDISGSDARREIKTQAIRKLELLEGIYLDLVHQAQGIIRKASEDLRLHQVPVNASKIRGQIYYLYQTDSDTNSEFFSILEPKEYSQADPQASFIRAYRLNEDGSWSSLDGS